VKPSRTIVDLYPSLLQPEGDRGNPLVLAHRAQQYGVEAKVVTVEPGDHLPGDADIICLAGSDDIDLPVAAERLRADGALAAAASHGAVIFGVGAGFALLANSFFDVDGVEQEGVGLLDVEMRDTERLIAGPVVSAARPDLGLPELSGYEYHRNTAIRGDGVQPWLQLTVGIGDGPRTNGVKSSKPWDGAWSGRVLGTWWHGPVLPRNPELADLLLRWAGVAVDPSGCAEDGIAQRVRGRRIAEARGLG
jgi:CobQ-like glutamine amidotransferase family enzyme